MKLIFKPAFQSHIWYIHIFLRHKYPFIMPSQGSCANITKMCQQGLLVQLPPYSVSFLSQMLWIFQSHVFLILVLVIIKWCTLHGSVEEYRQCTQWCQTSITHKLHQSNFEKKTWVNPCKVSFVWQHYIETIRWHLRKSLNA